MNTLRTSALAVAFVTTSAVLFAAESAPLPAPAETPSMPGPTKEHQWLHQFVGEWESEAEVTMAPDQPPTKTKGTKHVHALGGFWVVSQGTGEMPGMPQPMSWLMTIGFDPDKNKYVATWIDSMTGTLWVYEGKVEAGGKRLILETEGPCPTRPGTRTRFRDVTEFTSADERVFTSLMQEEDGSWTTMVKGTHRRKARTSSDNLF